jgi:sugar/nucleoside kinase (ribokinase family)
MLDGNAAAGVLNEVFGGMSERCQLYPVAAPGSCLALEFKTGKLMLADNLSVKTLDYDALIHSVGKEALTAMYSRADLIGYLNWSELHSMPSILRGTLRDIMPAVKNGGKRPIVLFDLSDCTARSKDDLEEALGLMARYSEFAMTILSLNENETRCLARVTLKKDPGSFESMQPAELQINVQRLSDVLGMQTLVIRGNKFTYAVEKNNAQAFTVVSTCYVDKPVLMTGAGDNFNAGMAAALLMGGNWEKALTLGTLEASRYIEYGSSATPEELIKYLNKRRLSQ